MFGKDFGLISGWLNKPSSISHKEMHMYVILCFQYSPDNRTLSKRNSCQATPKIMLKTILNVVHHT